ncbi:three-helix bundle dimerization domain-containing protein [Streptomyces noboritoensis]|uniref:Three-helix bundle dimerization domain-containing protein n=1 Tax=Streptomyces noboritoensis TaxID=67337 RepID=A0ABV6TD63_9ACTN
MAKDSEDAAATAHVADRLIKAFPHLDREAVKDAVETAYAELRYARVRTYLPMLMERRVRDLLAVADDRQDSGEEGPTG